MFRLVQDDRCRSFTCLSHFYLLPVTFSNACAPTCLSAEDLPASSSSPPSPNLLPPRPRPAVPLQKTKGNTIWHPRLFIALLFILVCSFQALCNLSLTYLQGHKLNSVNLTAVSPLCALNRLYKNRVNTGEEPRKGIAGQHQHIFFHIYFISLAHFRVTGWMDLFDEFP